MTEVKNATNAEMLAELAYRNIRVVRRSALLERAESYARDSRTFGDSIKLRRPLPDAGRWQLVYRIVADELRQVAASVGQDR